MINSNLLENSKFCSNNHRFLTSDLYILLIVMVGALGFIFKLEKYAMGLLLIILSYNLITTRDILPNIIVIFMIAMVPLARYAEDGYFYSLKYIAPLVVIAFILHFIIYKTKIKSPTFLYPTIAVAIAITLGGLFSSTFKDSFSMPALYYVFTLGIGMVGLYLLFEAYIPKDDPNIANYFARMMVGVGIMGIVMVLTNYCKFGHFIEDSFPMFFSKFQFGNNLSNCLLFSMPFSFYLSTIKGKRSQLYFTLGILQYLAIVFSLSRGGILFSTIILPFIMLATLYFNKNKKINMAINFLVIISVLTIVLLLEGKGLFTEVVNQINVSGDEARVKLYTLAWENFLKYPIFGTGLGYVGDRSFYNPQVWCIYWYHSTPFQILGSLGILGVISYGYQYIVRLRTLIKVKSIFNVFVLLSFAGYELYQLVNVGNFAPLPYVIMVIIMFIIADRYNNINLNNNNIFENEKFECPFKKK